GEGPHSITFTVVNELGNESAPSEPFVLTVDTEAPTAVPVLGAVYDDVGGIIGTNANNGVTDDRRPRFTGSGAEANARVNVYDDGTLIGWTTADANGNWEFTPSADLPEGERRITFSVEDAVGNEGPETDTPFVFTIDVTAPEDTPTVQVWDDQPPGVG